MVLLGWGAGLAGILLILSGYLGQSPQCVARRVIAGQALPPRRDTRQGFGDCSDSQTSGTAADSSAGFTPAVWAPAAGGSAQTSADRPTWEA